MLLNKRAQSTLEYAILVAVVVGALLAMQIYMKRGVQGRFKSSADDIGEQFDASRTTFSYTTSTTQGTTVEETTAGVTSAYTGKDNKGAAQIVTKKGDETVEVWTK